MTTPVYDPNTPAVAQNDDWSCAITSARWGMLAFGRHPTEQWIEATSLAEGVESKELGLMDATGAGLARFITEQYKEFGYGAYNVPVVSFNDVIQVAGLSPVLVGGRDWCHWVGVRRYEQSTGVLALANPAEHYMGVGQTLNRQQFAALGPFSMVVIYWGSKPVPVPTEDPALTIAALRGRVATLTAEVAALTEKRDSLIVSLAYVCDTVGDGHTALVKEAQRVRTEAIGPRPA